GYLPFVKLAEQCVRGAQKRTHRAVAAVVVQSASQYLGLSQTLQHLAYFVKLDQHATHLQTDLEALFKAGAVFREGAEDIERVLEPEARILECRSLSRLGPCLPEIAHRLFSELASKGVIGEPLDFGDQAIGIECLDRGNDPPMKLTPPIAQKPMIC